jgi:acetylornithine deacetylase
MFDPIEFTVRLIDIESLSGFETAIGDFLFDELTKLGYAHVLRQVVGGDRFNVWASPVERPRVVLNTHMDTVPPFIPASQDAEFIYGRGACDAKGQISAMIGAGERLRAAGIENFGLLFVVGEETSSDGAKSANEYFKDRGIQFVQVGEPTESNFARATKGALIVTAEFKGKSAHSSQPQLGDSAINKMVDCITVINGDYWGTNEILGSTTVNVGVVRGGTAANVIPDHAECEIVFRLVGPPEEVQAHLEGLVSLYSGRLVASRGNPPQVLFVPPGHEPGIVVAFGTDIPYLGNFGTPLLFGAGSILDAHSDHERVGKQALLDAVVTYYETVSSLCQS